MSDCKVINETYTVIGVAQIPTDAGSGLPNFSWTEGVSVIDTKPNRTFHKSFYFGAPPTTNLGGTGACAVFLTGVSQSVRFAGNDVARTRGTCEEALGADCVQALTSRAEALDVRGLGSTEACEKLRQDLEGSPIDPVCAKAANTVGKWSGVVARRKSLLAPRIGAEI